MRHREGGPQDHRGTIRVVVFTGGRGSGVLSSELLKGDRIDLTLAINGYDDGLSTGEVRRFLGDSLGPSDFRKNASRLAAILRTASDAATALLDLRLPGQYTVPEALASFRMLGDQAVTPVDEFQQTLSALAIRLEPDVANSIARRLGAFQAELTRTGRTFAFADCSLGNLVFAGGFLTVGRHFNAAVDDYCGLLGLPAGMIDNVTDGQNAYLVAVSRDGELLASEAEIVGAERPQDLRELHLLDHRVTPDEVARLAGSGAMGLERFLAGHTVRLAPNPRLLRQIEAADLIVYAPGTQHSSLFPSYMTPGVGSSIARNLKAVKILITNLQEDAEISGTSAVDLIDKALYYLRDKDRLVIPAPCLITHYLLNDPDRREPGVPYVPLGHLEGLEDPRLVRIGNYEEGVSGRHDAAKVLTPFITAFLRRGEPIRLVVLLLDADSLNKIGQTLIEMIRAGIEDAPVRVTVYYTCDQSFDADFAAALPFEARHLGSDEAATAALAGIARDSAFEYVMLFESSGMYKGDDIVSLAMQLAGARLDAVWGSRRLSVNDIKQAYRLVYRKKSLKAVISYVGSHLLSLSYLVLYGRYISDTLSGIRVVRSSMLQGPPLDPRRSDFNQAVLSGLLRQRAEVLEIPVYYFPISPEKVRRTTVADGLRALATILHERWRPRREASPSANSAPEPP